MVLRRGKGTAVSEVSKITATNATQSIGRQRGRQPSAAPAAVPAGGRGRSGIPQPTAQTILAADFGSVNTRIVLFDVVDGRYRLVSRAQTLTTADAPVGPVRFGVPV